MGTHSTWLNRFILLSVFLATALPVHADPGKDLFDKQCASCHTIGGGDSGGPDLKGVVDQRPVEWLVKVIVEPDKLMAAKDPVQAELVKKYGFEMPVLGISRDDALKIIAWLKGGTTAPGAQPSPDAAKPVETVVTPELAAQGKALFTGRKPFAKGGAPCAACHQFHGAGGNLAVDLTDLYEGMGEQGMRGVLKSLKFPIMNSIYANRPLTEDEISAIIAFAKDPTISKSATAATLFPVGGVGVFIAFIAGMIFYKRRIR